MQTYLQRTSTALPLVLLAALIIIRIASHYALPMRRHKPMLIPSIRIHIINRAMARAWISPQVHPLRRIVQHPKPVGFVPARPTVVTPNVRGGLMRCIQSPGSYRASPVQSNNLQTFI